MESNSEKESNSSDKMSLEDYEDDIIETDKIISIKAKLNENQYDYKLHKDLINELKLMNRKYSLRKARENMQKYFPLDEEIWLEWFDDECLENLNKNEILYICNLYEKAVLDYQSVKIWLHYCQFKIDNMQTSDEILEIRKLFERAIISVGLHVVEGSGIWDGYREFEENIYESYKNHSNLTNNESNEELLNNQKKRVLNIFNRQLLIPLLNLKETHDLYNVWIKENNIDEKEYNNMIDKTYEKLDKCIPFEKELIDNNYNIEVFEKYLNYEKSDNNPNRVICLYERAICKNCLNINLWINYIDYLNNILKDSNNALNVCTRAIRNISWSSSIWICFIKTMELYNIDHEIITKYFDEAVQIALCNSYDSLNLRCQYGYYLFRYIKKLNGDINEVINYFENSYKEHKDSFGSESDPECLFLKSLALIYEFNNNGQKVIECWNKIIQVKSNDIFEWIHYLEISRRYDLLENTCKRYIKCLKMHPNYTYFIQQRFIILEHLCDNITSIEKYQHIINEIIANQNINNNIDTKESRKRKIVSNFTQTKKIKHENNLKNKVENTPVKEEINLNINNDIKKSGKQDISYKPLEPISLGFDPNNSIFVSNIDFKTTENELENILSVIGIIDKVFLVKNSKNQSKGYGYVQFNNESTCISALNYDRKIKIGLRPIYISKIQSDKQIRPKIFKTSNNEDTCLYISKLHQSVTEQHLNYIFNQYPGFIESRLAIYRNGNSKGFAYIEFDTKEHASHALIQEDNKVIHGKAICIEFSNPPKKIQNKLNERKPILGENITKNVQVNSKLNLSNDDFKRIIKR